MKYEIIVVGAGHAGIEASLAAARKGHQTLLITSNINNVADMACNPSIGGSAKGIIVREIDALGGQMGKTADISHIQIKMLNNKKGPAVRALRAQIDKVIYPQEMLKVIKQEQNLILEEGMVEDLIINNGKIEGIILEDGKTIWADAVILTTGTYLKADIMVGNKRRRSGPHDEKPSLHLSDKLREYGFEIIRLKTGTPPRIAKNSIDFEKTKLELGDNEYYTFSFDNEIFYQIENQTPCHLVYTNELTHQIINDNLNKSSMYGGLDDVTGVGPRYCPSIEDKVVRFSDKERHQLFLEPESKYYDDIYIQGLSTSMPVEVQEQIVKSIHGLEKAQILKYAYAIEYDAIMPTQLKQSLETKLVENLYTAGQINGTSGYEEAACQGLIAGINASLKLEGKEPLILKRSDAYIGVLIDDLITKGIKDPYRLLTSRAEYRLLLRHDNADIRLREYGYKMGLVNDSTYKKYQQKINDIEALTETLKKTKLIPKGETNKFLLNLNSAPIKDGITLYDLLKRPEITFDKIITYINKPYSKEIIDQVELNIKYEGYILKEQKEAEKMINLENKKIPEDINYDLIPNIASEARQKLKQVNPTSIGQALRISGVNPADISILMVYLKKERQYE